MHPRAQAITLEHLARLLDAKLIGRADHMIESVADLDTAQSKDLSFFHNEKYRPALKRSKAGAIIAIKAEPDTPQTAWLIHDNPSAAFQKAIEHFCPKLDTTPYKGIHPSAVIDPCAEIGQGVDIGPLAIIGPRTKVAQDCYIGPGCIIGADVVIGKGSLLHSGVIIREACLIGERVILQPGCVIGSCGFGYNTVAGKHYKLEQLGQVIIEDDVEIGANTCIDRARFKQTRIARGTKIDNLVMIGHGVEVGCDNIIVAQAGIAGSTKTGRWVVLGGQVGVAGHVNIGDGVMIAAQAGVTKNLTAGTYGGSPALPVREWHQMQANVKSVHLLKERMRKLENELTLLRKTVDKPEVK